MLDLTGTTGRIASMQLKLLDLTHTYPDGDGGRLLDRVRPVPYS